MHATIDETIARVEQLYTSMTGRPPPPVNGGAPIPPESDPVAHVQDQLGRLLSSIERLVPHATGTSTWTPHATSWRDEAGTTIVLDIPGVPRAQVQLALDRGTLVVTAQRATPPLGTFRRVLALGSQVAAEHVNARLEDGVLTIRITGSTRSEPSQIPIRS